MKTPWWLKKKLPAEDGRPAISQHVLCAVAFCKDNTCDHEWECVSDVWLGVGRDLNTWMFMDVCRCCEAVRMRRVTQGTEEAIAADILDADRIVAETRPEQVKK